MRFWRALYYVLLRRSQSFHSTETKSSPTKAVANDELDCETANDIPIPKLPQSVRQPFTLPSVSRVTTQLANLNIHKIFDER